ncbi:MAG: orotate phosphoribosyltransferase [Deltaproteobacteria bacterium]|nr:orotate phosphoribosyltransferase [Deltaproteobacteria bacterium]
MQDSRAVIAQLLLETGSIQVYKDRPFVFVSGRISPVYIDCRRLLSFPAAIKIIVDQLARKVESEIGTDAIDVVAGGETAGIPYAAFVSYRLGKPMIYVRKNPKGYGGTKQIEGILNAGQKVLLVEDLITDGLSKLRFNIGIRAQGARITDCLCVFEYGSDRLSLHEGKNNLAAHDIRVHALANWDDVLETVLSKNYFSVDATSQIWDFLQQPEGWGRKMGFA